MDPWQDEPSIDGQRSNFRIVRTQPGTGMRVIILSTKHVGARTHYWKGRTVACTQETCEACQAGHESRWHGHLLVLSEKTGEVAIWEYPESAHTAITTFLKDHPTLRGAILTAKRANQRPNSRVYAALSMSARESESLPSEIDLKPILARIWEFKANAPMEFTRPTLDLSPDRTRSKEKTNGKAH